MPDNYTGANLVFVVGSPRSGTTWVQKLLAAHPRIFSGQESDVFDLYVGPQLRTWARELEHDTSGRGGLGLACYFLEDEFIAVLRRYLLDLLQPMVGELQPGELFVEKTPSHVMFIAEIRKLLPDARFVHVLRDGRDVVASILAASRSWGSQWAPKSARAAAQMWATHVDAGLAAAATLPPEVFIQVRYEELLADTDDWLRTLIDLLGLEWDQAGIAAAVDANTAGRTATGGGTELQRRGEFARRTGEVVREPAEFVRRGRVGSYRVDLSLRQRLTVELLARRTLAAAGYAR
jgi:hypothetical protein